MTSIEQSLKPNLSFWPLEIDRDRSENTAHTPCFLFSVAAIMAKVTSTPSSKCLLIYSFPTFPWIEEGSTGEEEDDDEEESEESQEEEDGEKKEEGGENEEEEGKEEAAKGKKEKKEEGAEEGEGRCMLLLLYLFD